MYSITDSHFENITRDCPSAPVFHKTNFGELCERPGQEAAGRGRFLRKPSWGTDSRGQERKAGGGKTEISCSQWGAGLAAVARGGKLCTRKTRPRDDPPDLMTDEQREREMPEAREVARRLEACEAGRVGCRQGSVSRHGLETTADPPHSPRHGEFGGSTGATIHDFRMQHPKEECGLPQVRSCHLPY